MAAIQRMAVVIFQLLFVVFMSGVNSASVLTISAGLGENVSLPCVNPDQGSILSQMQWQRQIKDEDKDIMIVYHPQHGQWTSPNLRGGLSIVKHLNNKIGEFRLDLLHLQTNDSGLYICEITIYPTGTIQRHVKLEVKGKDDPNTPSLPPTTDSNGSSTAQPTTSVAMTTTLATSTDTPMTSSLSSSEGEELRTTTSPSSSSTTTTTQEHHNTTWSLGSHGDNVNVTRHIPVTGRATAHDQQQNVSLVYQNNTTAMPTTSGGTHEEADRAITRVSHEDPTWRNSTRNATQDESSVTQKTHTPVVTATPSPQPDRSPSDDTTGSSSLYLACILLPLVAVVLITAVLYRRYIIRKRMDLPPPFKPPPPPVKYTSVQQDIMRQREILMTDILV
ncbi:location of vulva defective 1 [Engraulis encrasicolus]|uniref:location of vulva defective 1 n=1 Tax=Engraulis encrasicolus TaxID=184585 RepID=UPI002FCED13A